MLCSRCGAQNDAGARFCAACGATLARVCPACGKPADADASFCSSCGSQLDVGVPAKSEERKVVTVLFADLVGFTGRSEQLDPESVRRLLDPFFAGVRAECERRGGTVEKFIGDAAMAVFGSPIAHEDDPERGVRAALAIVDAVAELNKADPSRDLHVRLAVNTGEALVSVGRDRRESEWLATGDIVNTCARMQAAAPVDTVIVGEATMRATRDVIEYREVDSIVAKGKSQPVPVWAAIRELAALGTDRHRADASFVGRRREMEVLAEAFARTRDSEQTQLVTIVGAPGMGKSRLVWELWRALEEMPQLAISLQGRSLPYGEGASAAALGEMVKTWAGILESDSIETAREKVDARVAQLLGDSADAAWVDSHLRRLVGIAEPDDAAVGARRDEAFAAWRRFFEALAEHQLVILVFEDLHWADDSLLDFVDHLIDWTTDVPMLVIATARPELLERRRDWGGGKLNALTISLSPLSAFETETLLTELLDNVSLSPELRGELIVRAGGNPLYAAEYARMLLDRGITVNGHADVPVPETVQGIIAARLDVLQRDEKELLQDASVLGETFWAGALAKVGGRARPAVEGQLRGLERKEFARRERRSTVEGDLQYAFRHMLVRDVAYAQIPRARRAEKHRRAAEWLESMALDRGQDRAEMVAYHYVTAFELAAEAGQDVVELRERAWRAAQEAGDHAASVAAYAAAARFYETARKLAPETDAGRPELFFRLGRSLYHSRQEGAAELEEAREGLREQGNLELAAEADVLLAGLLTSRGRGDQGRERLVSAAELSASSGSARAHAHVLTELSRALVLAGELDEALRVGREALDVAGRGGLPELRAQALVNVGIARVTGGDLSGTANLEAAIMLAREVNSPESVRATRMLASMHLLLGRLDRAADLYASAREQADRFGNAFEKRWLTAARALELHWQGNWDDALAVAEEFLSSLTAGGQHYMEANCRQVRGEIRLARGELDAALAEADAACEFMQPARDPWFLYPSLTLRARALLALGRDTEAAAILDDLLKLEGLAERVLLMSFRTASSLAASMRDLGRQDELAQRIAGTGIKTPWLDAATAFLAGDFDFAADLYDRIGSLADAAEARLLAAESLASEGDRVGAEAELASASAFFAQAGAPGRVCAVRERIEHATHT
jgi:class 3 adenylate cyclase/tetratricopeptide (TPR) repeat protein